MSELMLAVCITQRSRFTALAGILKKHAVPYGLVSLGRGTATSERLDMLGMDDAEKAIYFCVLTAPLWRDLKKSLQNELHIDVPGTGIAFTVPLSSVGGKTALRVLTHGTDFERGEESRLKDTNYEMLLAVCEQGFSQKVMEAAKKGGAGGGTVIRARGTGVHTAEQFLGITLTGEKDMIFIVSKTDKKDAIMNAVMREAGANTRAKTIIFSLPVTDTAGLRLTENEAE